MTATQRRSHRITNRHVTRDELLESLRKAAEQKGATPTGPDADHHRFGLFAKQRYISAFGKWNEAVKQAGLTPNPWTRQRVIDHEIHTEAVSEWDFLDKQIERERIRLEVLQELRGHLV